MPINLSTDAPKGQTSEDRQVLHNLYDEMREEARRQRERAVIAEVRLYEEKKRREGEGYVFPPYVLIERITGAASLRNHYADEQLRRAFNDGVCAAVECLRDTKGTR